MRTSKAESWVTVAGSDADAWSALVLARSIRKSITTRKLTIRISDGVSSPLKQLLETEYDLVARVDNAEINSKSALTKLWIWNLEIWDKCVYLEPCSFMLKFSDELFMGSDFEFFAHENQNSPFGFVFRPNKNILSDIIGNLNNSVDNENTNIDSILRRHFDLEAKNSRTSPNVVLTDFKDFLGSNSKTGNKARNGFLPREFEKLTYSWITTFVHEVLPKVEIFKDESTRKALLQSIENHNLPTTNGPRLPGQPFDLGDLKDSIAIVGMSSRFPGANSPDEFWDLLVNGRDGVGDIPLDRPMSKNVETQFQAGFLKCPVDEFDAKFFNISPREALFVDPQQRLLLECIWESLENANINPQTLRGSNTAVYLGIWQQDYDRRLPDKGLTPHEFHHRYVGNAFSATAARISFFLGLFGPNLAIESGCSSSSSAIHLACEALRNNNTNLAIASGVNLVLRIFNPFAGTDAEAKTVILSSDYRCKTFDQTADGFVRAEGCGSVVLKRYVDAIADGDNVIGLVRGSSLNNDGPGTSLGTPNAKAQERVYREALQTARVEPKMVSYVEAHGTGTIVGDPTEVRAIGNVYSDGRTDPLYISSVKTNIGHAEACAGMAGLIKILLCFKNRTIPPHLHLQKLNPEIDLDRIPARIPLEPTPWLNEPRLAGLSSFSMSGTNVHLILQDPPLQQQIPQHFTKPDCKLQLVCLSTKSEEALESLRKAYMSFLEKDGASLSLSDIAYSTNTGRANLSHRIGIIAKDTEQLLRKLETRSYTISRNVIQRQKIVYLYTGQGSQYVGMGKSLYVVSQEFRNALDQCAALFEHSLKASLFDVLWRDSGKLEKTVYCQPAIFCIEWALFQWWKSFGLQPDIIIGHSVGEFCAAACAGVLSLDDAFKLVVERSRFVESLPAGSMMAVKASHLKVENLIASFMMGNTENWIDIAAINSAEEVIVSGLPQAVDAFSKFCNDISVKSQQLPASHAFHSRQMDLVLQEFGEVVEKVTNINSPNCVYISGTVGKEMEKSDFTTSYWQQHLRDTVRFTEAIKLAWSAEGRIFIEIGSQPILLGLTMANFDDSSAGTFCPSLRKTDDDLHSILTSLNKIYVAGIDINWKTWFGNRYKKVILPNYPFQRQKFWFVPDDDLEEEEPLLHPLLGKPLPSPVSEHLFTQTLKRNEIKWIEDHRVADRVILPAAAFLELIMRAGNQVLQDGRVQIPFSVNDMTVELPLSLDKPTQIQTIVRTGTGSGEELKYDIGVYKRIEHKFRKCSAATFYPVPNGGNHLNPEISVSSIQRRLTLSESMAAVYDGIHKIGIQFGPKFQSIQKAWSGENEILAEIHLPEGSEYYICHPIVLDAMIQCIGFRNALVSKEVKPTLQLPVLIKKTTWFPVQASNVLYAYSDRRIGESSVSLYNTSGQLLGTMEGIELARTTVHSFLNFLNSDRDYVPPFFEEKWRPTTGLTRSRIDPYDLSTKFGAQVEKCMRENLFGDLKDKNLFNYLERCFLLYLVRGIQEVGWPWYPIGHCIRADEWMKLRPKTLSYFKTEFFLTVLAENGYLQWESENSYRVLKDLIPISACDDELNEIFQECESAYADGIVDLLYTKRFEQLFTPILRGELTPFAAMFPIDSHETGAIRFYTESKQYCRFSACPISMIVDAVDTINKRAGPTGVLRILEVGAGSGYSSMQLMDRLTDLGIPFQFTFTDISQAFFIEAQKNLPKDVNYALLNIEEDPLTQGFAPEEYDIILAMQVIHATQDIRQSLTNIRAILRDGGLLVVGELLRPSNVIALTFGFLEGWWRFNDFRRLTPIVNMEGWRKCFEDTGFVETNDADIHYGIAVGYITRKSSNVQTIIPTPANTKRATWLVLGDNTELSEALTHKLQKYNRNIVMYENEIPKAMLEGVLIMQTTLAQNPFEVKQDFLPTILKLLQNILHSCFEIKNKPKLILVTRGVYYIGDSEPGNPNNATAQAMFRVLCNESPNYHVRVIDADQNDTRELWREAEEVFGLFWNPGRDIFQAVRDDRVYVQRFNYSENRRPAITLPNSDRFKVTNSPSKSLSDIPIIPSPKFELAGSQVEVKVEACALNFRDLFLMLQPEGFEMPKRWTHEPGMDIAGIVAGIGPEVKKLKIGDKVFGISEGSGLASHVVVNECTLMLKPEALTFTSASTIPCAFATVTYSLVESAKLTSSDRILIHVATGGVGLAAIQMANHVGAEIFATAGSRKKRAYLRSIGIKHVYHSRNTEFGKQILEDTNGMGVTVVLNSLTGPNFKESSLMACAEGARFVEIGKINIWSVEDVKALRPDVEYFIIDLSIFEPDELRKQLDLLEDQIHHGQLQGLPHETFPLELVHHAFHYFQEAKHIGKIVLKTPCSRLTNEGRMLHDHNIFNEDATYLITGGLGGIGIEVAKWMTQKGASYLVLAGRSPPNPRTSSTIQTLIRQGKHIAIVQGDIGQYKDCSTMLKKIGTLNWPPLRGIMHAAGILSDSIIISQSWETFQRALKPKLDGTWNLHTLTLGMELEFFTMFSSLTVMIGMPGQSNHAAANHFLDSFSNYRRSLGLPCSTINFGPWAEVGAAADLKIVQEGAFGVRAFSPKQGIASMEKIFRERLPQVTVVEVVDWKSMLSILNLGCYFDDIIIDEKSEIVLSEELEAMIEEIKSSPPEERQPKIEEFLELVIKQTLRIPENEHLDRNQNFSEIGVDSLMAMEMKNRLQGLLDGKTLGLSALQENRTIRSLSSHLARLMNADSEDEILGPEKTAQLAKVDSILPDDIIVTGIPSRKPSEFRHILLTDVIGHYGVNFLAQFQESKPELQIHCIVPISMAKDKDEAKKLLLGTLQYYELVESVNLELVSLYVGDIRHETLGLPEDDFDWLAANIDAVVHCATRVHHVETYAEGGMGSLRVHNVIGTRNVLKFMGTAKTKALLHVSTIIASTEVNEDGFLLEEFPSQDIDLAKFPNGYQLSRLVSEILVREAKQRGFPVICVRFNMIFGHSKTGIMPSGYNQVSVWLHSCIRLRKFPRYYENCGVPIMSVDTAADISTKLFLSDTAEKGVYNMTSNTLASEDEIKEVFEKFGVTGEFVSFKEWRDALAEEAEDIVGPLVEYYDLEQERGKELPSGVNLHPLGLSFTNVRMNELSQKLQQNCKAEHLVFPFAKDILERQLQCHFKTTLQKTTTK